MYHVLFFQLVNWLAIMNTIGGVCFWIAASCGLFEVENAKWYVDFPYLIGSIAFGMGSFCALWMWKNEYYGLGLISEINIEREDNREKELDVLEEYGISNLLSNSNHYFNWQDVCRYFATKWIFFKFSLVKKSFLQLVRWNISNLIKKENVICAKW